jgi:hypothetical protein
MTKKPVDIHRKTQKQVRMSEADLALLAKARRVGGFKTDAETIVEGLRRLAGQSELSREALLAEIERRLK